MELKDRCGYIGRNRTFQHLANHIGLMRSLGHKHYLTAVHDGLQPKRNPTKKYIRRGIRFSSNTFFELLVHPCRSSDRLKRSTRLIKSQMAILTQSQYQKVNTATAFQGLLKRMARPRIVIGMGREH